MNEGLVAARKKVSRAGEKVDTVHALVQKYSESEPFSVRTAMYSGLTFYIARLEKQPPDDIAWETVEAVQHLRGALDKLVVAFVEKNGRGTSGVGFPFAGERDGITEAFPSLRAMKELKPKLSDDQWNFLLKADPSCQGNFALWSINELANYDKHRAGLVAATSYLSRKVSVNNGFARNLHIGPVGFDHLLVSGQQERILFAVGESSPGAIRVVVGAHVIFENAGRSKNKYLCNLLSLQLKCVRQLLAEAEPLLN